MADIDPKRDETTLNPSTETRRDVTNEPLEDRFNRPTEPSGNANNPADRPGKWSESGGYRADEPTTAASADADADLDAEDLDAETDADRTSAADADADADATAAPDANRDPLSGEPGAHPVGTGLGAAAGGAAAGAATGAVIGTVAGPLGTAIGTAIGTAVGGVIGGYAGKGIAESVNPTAEDAYWRENYRTRSYVEPDEDYALYQGAYQYGWESRQRYPDKEWGDVEPDLRRDWEAGKSKSVLSWDRAKHAIRDSWDRLAHRHHRPEEPQNR